MPLYKDFSDDVATVLVWEYDENEMLDPVELLEPENQYKILGYHPNKIAEVLMVRKMLKTVLPDHKILYRENGEPYLFPQDQHISVSHSFPLAALAISKNKVGIDLEKRKEKIRYIRHKFILHEDIFIDNNEEVDFLTAIWCVKEALYKIHHSKHWSLKKHYDVLPFELHANFTVKSRVYDLENEDFFKARISFFDNYCLAIVD
ncbi:MAG: 4'-phosphopantetheinyl transferase superfamily protein [Chryseobacterium sp.]|uniref:4'-phosphopantetheinyl transferase family protein n=1 Tax=Epilithonimonas caeni TaxID=365343 RepID=UPI0003FA7610|nr:4'-phosphopantetheinyl transferase family protein [Epilithonimonas caeni]MPS73621.1 4'-phosphopantetheinyl transferase superfamily protein [Chryseobacterium sp.]